jgi:hypothetical protein
MVSRIFLMSSMSRFMRTSRVRDSVVSDTNVQQSTHLDYRTRMAVRHWLEGNFTKVSQKCFQGVFWGTPNFKFIIGVSSGSQRVIEDLISSLYTNLKLGLTVARPSRQSTRSRRRFRRQRSGLRPKDHRNDKRQVSSLL